MSEGSKHNIPIKMGDFSVIDSEFNSIRERFDAEMRKMEDEMNRFRSELITREAPSPFGGLQKSSITSNTSSQHTTSSTTGAPPVGMSTDLVSRADPRNWLESINSPLIQDEGENKHLKLRFDVSQYKPEEIVVKTVDNKLMVHAKHEEKSESRSVYREYNREFLLPKGTNPELIKSSLSKDGVLTVEAPLPGIAGGETRIPIDNK